MHPVNLVNRAKSAGLTVELQGNDLRIRGPKSAAAIVQELKEHKAAVWALLSTNVAAAAVECQDVKTGSGLAEGQAVARCTAARCSTNQSWHPSETTPATITHDGKSYDVAFTSGMWFFRRAPECGWTNCSDEFAAIIEEELQGR